ncbi:MAG: hypothetical protein JOZ93_00975 [Sinobacteraceae bacterium]|nr:hypothetical protein [Nevskiaceae bacterium]
MQEVHDRYEAECAEPSADDVRKLRDMYAGHHTAQALYVMAELGIADLLRSGARDSDELAESTQSHPQTLYRVLRFLAAQGILAEVAPGRFALTTLGAPLRSDVTGSLRPLFRYLLNDFHWLPWGRLLETVRTGVTPFGQVYGMTSFDYLDLHPEAAALFRQGLSRMTLTSGRAVAAAYDFSKLDTVVDVGGSEGALLAVILKHYPNLRGILFDRPAAVSTTQALLTGAGVADRCSISPGSFFEAIPAGGDAYILRHILHDWSDERCVAILRVCRATLTPDARLLIIERSVAEDAQLPLSVLHADLEMLVMCGGQERTEAHYAELLRDAGFRLTNAIATGEEPPHTIYEAIPA